MKSITLAFLLATIQGLAQLPIDPETKKFTYTEVIEQSGLQKDLYLRAREWFVHAYQNADDVIQMDEKESGRIIGKGKSSIYLSMNTRYIRHTVTIDIKDNKYRYIITNFVLDWGNGVATEPFETLQKMYQKKAYTKTAEIVPDIIASLKKAMSTNKNDW
jgi:hypothetical protein